MSKRLIQLGALIVSFLGVFPGEAGQLKWRIDQDARWTELDLPQLGKTGFTLISSDQTGITFTNHLDEWSSAPIASWKMEVESLLVTSIRTASQTSCAVSPGRTRFTGI
jgi:hypothetical protein